MDIIEKVFSIAHAIHSQFEHVRCCKHQCQRLVERIHILLGPVRVLQAQPSWQISHHEEQMLTKLLQALGEAQKLVIKYSQTSWIQKFLSARSSGEEFVWVNRSLEDIAQGLSLLLQAEQKQALLEAFQTKICRRQDAEDLRDDKAFLDQVIASKCAFSVSLPQGRRLAGSWQPTPAQLQPDGNGWGKPKGPEKLPVPVLHIHPAHLCAYLSYPRYQRA